MKKSVLSAVLLALVFPCMVFAGELALFDNGKLNGAKRRQLFSRTEKW